MDFLNAKKILEKLQKGELEVKEVVEQCFERIKKLDTDLNSFITLNEEKALEKAEETDPINSDKPLAGLPIAVKDNEPTKGLKTTYGSKLYENNVPQKDSILVKRLKDAGVIVIGKTNLPQFALLPYTDNALQGPTRNPWNLDKTPGGSGGGSAAAVAARMVPAATGNDGAGSIRRPASFSCHFGFKPTLGRVPYHPKKPIFIGLISEGFHTITVEDTALLIDAAAGRDFHDIETLFMPKKEKNYFETTNNSNKVMKEIENKKIALSSDLGFATLDAEVYDIIMNAVSKFENLVEIEEIDVEIPKIEKEFINKITLEPVSMMKDRLDEWKKNTIPDLRKFAKIANSVSKDKYINISERKNDLWASLRPIFQEYDYLITPTVAVPPFDVNGMPTKVNGKKISPLGWMPFTYPFNFTGQPAASVPAGFTDEGLPVGMQIIGKHRDDLGVLKASKAYQEINPWENEIPKIVENL